MILLKNNIFLFKKEMHIFNMPESFVRSFRLVAEELLEKLNVQTFHSVLVRNSKISKSQNAVILSKMIFFSFQKRRFTSLICLNHLCDEIKFVQLINN